MSIFIILPLILVTFIVFIFSVFWLAARYRRVTIYICLVFVATGFSLYTAGYMSSGAGFLNAMYAALHGIFSTARMIGLEEDYGYFVDAEETRWLAGNLYMQILFWFCHVAGLVLIQIALISVFGKKLIDGFRLRFGLHNEIFIIKGSGKNALLLGRNIATRDARLKRADTKSLVVFLLDNEDDEEKFNEETESFGGIVHVMNNRDLSGYLKKATLGKRDRKYKIVIMPGEDVPDNVQQTVEYSIEKNVYPDNLDIFVFVSTEWEKTKVELIFKKKEGEKRKYPYTPHIINEIDLLSRQMIEKLPPWNCPALNFKNGEASHDFTVMILGFGPVGQSALLYLIRNGQFVGSRMRAIIIDKDMDNLRDAFLYRNPGLNLCCDMDFKKFDIQSGDFFTLLNKTDNIDYVVMALSGEKLNKQTALDVQLNYDRKNGCFPFIAIAETNRASREPEPDEKICVFGYWEGIYKESIVIREKTDRMAKAVNNVYKEMYGGFPWHELDWFTQESNRASADFIPAMLKLSGIGEKEAVEKNTLTTDAALAETLAKTEHLRWNAFHATMGYRPISIEGMRQRFENYTGEKNTRAHIDYCRRDVPRKLHSCLVTWDELDKVGDCYKELARLAGNSKEQKRDFKENDRDNIRNIPTFIREANK